MWAAGVRVGLVPGGALVCLVLVVVWWLGTGLPQGLLGAGRCWCGRGLLP